MKNTSPSISFTDHKFTYETNILKFFCKTLVMILTVCVECLHRRQKLISRHLGAGASGERVQICQDLFAFTF